MSREKIQFLSSGLYVVPDSGDPYLVGSRCRFCEEVYFPKKTTDYCIHCQQNGLKDVPLSRTGVVAAFTVSEQAPSGGFYRGRVPYAYGYVDLPEGVRIPTQFSTDFEALMIGRRVELVVEKIAESSAGESIVSYMFR